MYRPRTGTGEVTRGHTGGRNWRKQRPRQRTGVCHSPKERWAGSNAYRYHQRFYHEKDRSHSEVNTLLRWKHKADNKGLKSDCMERQRKE